MKKTLKTIFLACLTVCAVACMSLFATACGDNKDDGNKDDEKSDTITVTVLLPNGDAATGVVVQICYYFADGGDLCLAGKAVDSNGKCVENKNEIVEDLARDDIERVEIHLQNIPGGYVYVDGNGDPFTEGTGLSYSWTSIKDVNITLQAA